MTHIPVQIDTRSPLFIEANAEDFGRIFAAMNSEEQVAVLSAIVTHMRPHPMQWDYIAIELEKPENLPIRNALASAIAPSEGWA